jgi:uncharacterized membrane protein YjgN (DUF898 family)
VELLVLNCRFPYTHTREHVLVVISLMVIFCVFVCGTTNPLVVGKNSVPIGSELEFSFSLGYIVIG